MLACLRFGFFCTFNPNWKQETGNSELGTILCRCTFCSTHFLKGSGVLSRFCIPKEPKSLIPAFLNRPICLRIGRTSD